MTLADTIANQPAPLTSDDVIGLRNLARVERGNAQRIDPAASNDHGPQRQLLNAADWLDRLADKIETRLRNGMA